MSIAKSVAERSYDPRLKVGAIIVSDDNTRLLALGYNGNYRGGPHEPESSDPGRSGFIHAEVNALVKCDYNFNRKKIMYLTHSPCSQCAKLIVNANISEVVYDAEYRDSSGLAILTSCGIVVNRFSDVIFSGSHEET
jgi:dCMP deaminase